MDKIKRIASLLEKLEISPQKVVLKWAQQGTIDLKQIASELETWRRENAFVRNWYDIRPGMYLYKNGKISHVYAENECQAVVLDVDTQNSKLLMMSLCGKVLPFSSQGYSFDTSGLLNGLNATYLLSQMAQDANCPVEAAQYCLNYSDAFVDAGMAFLLTEDEAKSLSPCAEQILLALNIAHVQTNGFWLSSSSGDCSNPEKSDKKEAKVFILHRDKVAINREYTTVPAAVYPVFRLSSGKLSALAE